MNSSNSSYNPHRLCRGVFNNWCIAIGTDLLFLTRLIAHRGRFLVVKKLIFAIKRMTFLLMLFGCGDNEDV